MSSSSDSKLADGQTSATEPRKKWSRLKRVLLVSLGLALLVRVAIPLLLPSLLSSLVADQGLLLRYEKLDLAVLTGSIELWHVDVLCTTEDESQAEEPVAHLEYLLADLDVSALLTGTLRLHRVEVDGLDVFATRKSLAEGWNFERLLSSAASDQETVAEAEEDDEQEFEGYELGLPLEISALRLQHLQLHIRDDARAPVFETKVELNVRISDLGHESRSARLEVFAHSTELLDAFEVKGSLKGEGAQLSAQLHCQMRGLQLRELAPYIENSGLRPNAENIDLELSLELETEANDEEGLELNAVGKLFDIELRTDGEESLAIDRIELNAPRVSPTHTVIDTSLVRGVRARVRRLADGNLSIAGIDLVPAAEPRAEPAEEAEATLVDAESAQEEEATAEDEQAQEAASEESLVEEDAPKNRLSIASLRLEDLLFTFDDEGIFPPTELEWVIEELSLNDIQLDPANLEHAAQLQARMRSPEIIEEFVVQGEIIPFAPLKRCELGLEINGIRPDRISPYLSAAGLRSNFVRGHFQGQLSASTSVDTNGVLHADASFSKLRLADDGEIFAVEELGLTGLSFDPDEQLTRIEQLAWTGTHLVLRRDSARDLHLLGLATGANPMAPDTRVLVDPAEVAVGPKSVVVDSREVSDSEESGQEATSTAPPEAPTPSVAPAPPESTALPESTARIEIERVAWTHTTIDIIDESFIPTLELRLDDFGFEMDELTLGGSSLDDESAPAKLKLWFAANGLARKLELQGHIHSRPGPLDIDVELNLVGRGLTLQAIEPWLKELGLETQLAEGELDMSLETSLKQTGTGLQASLELSDLLFSNGEETLLGLSKLSLPKLSLEGEALRIDELIIEAPYLKLGRDSEGAVLALGLRLPAQAAGEAEKGPEPVTPSVQPSRSPSQAAEQPASETQSSFALDHFALSGARIDWSDASIEGGLTTALTLEVKVDDLLIGASDKPTRCEIILGLEGSLEELRIQSEAKLDPKDWRLASTLSLQGLHAGVLEPYLPPGVEMPLVDGRLGAELLASYAERAEGDGHAARIELMGLDYRDAGAEFPMLAFERLALVAPRLDAEGAFFEIEEVSISGLEVASKRTSSTRFELLGLAFDEVPAPEPNETETQATTAEGSSAPDADAVASEDGAAEDAYTEDEKVAAEDAAERTPEVKVVTAPPMGAPVPSAAALKPPADRIVPTILLGKLDIGIAHFRFHDESAPNSVPLDASLKLSTHEAITLLAPKADELEPIEFFISGGAPPILAEIDSRIRLTPFELEPSISMELALRGLRGEGLTEVVPDLSAKLDGSALPDGLFEASVEGHLMLRRRGPVDFDISDGFGADLEVKGISLHDKPGGKQLLGIEAMTVSVKSIRPESGDVHIERIELVQPMLHAMKSKEGLHVAGLVLKNSPEEESEESEEEEEEPAESEAVAEATSEQTATAEAAPSGEIRIDELLISGADISYLDNSIDPPMHLPIAEFDLELKRFSTRTLTEERPFRFNASLYGGEITLPERDVSGTFVGGLLSSVGSLVTLADDYETEERPVFDEIILRGNMSLGPEPKGWTLLRVRALELPAFRGNVRGSGVDIGDGLLDETVMLHFNGEGGLRISSDTKLSYLSLSEPAGGPISSYLKLPMPLDAVLFVLKDDEGDQVIPLHLQMQDGAASLGEIAGAVGKTLGVLIGDAIAGSPMRLVGGVLELVGFGDDPIELEGDEFIQLEFAPGEVQTPEHAARTIAPLLDLLRMDETLYLVVEHQLSAADLEHCDVLANPTPADCLDLAENLRRHRMELLTSREELASEARSAYAIGRKREARNLSASLRTMDQEIGRTEAALDRVYDQTRPGAERGRARRARGTATEIARRRLAGVVDLIKSHAIASIGTRCDSRRPRFGVTPDIEHGTILVTVRQRQ